MAATDPPVIELSAHEEDGQVVYEFEPTQTPSGGSKIQRVLWGIAGALVGIAMAAVFLTVFLYVVLPLIVILVVATWIRRAFAR